VYRNLKNKLGVYPKRVITDSGPTFGNDFKQYVEYHYDRSLKVLFKNNLLVRERTENKSLGKRGDFNANCSRN